MSAPSHTSGAIRVAVVNDCSLVVEGLASLLSRYPGRIEVVEVAAGQPIITGLADVVLYDAYAGTEVVAELVPRLIRQSEAKIIIYSWHIDPNLILDALDQGAAGYLSKEMSADELVQGIEAIYAGDTLTTLIGPALGPAAVGDWPGRETGLTPRESEVLAFVAAGLSNQEIAESLYLSINSVKTYVRTAYRKIGAVRRSQAVIWAMQNGFEPGGSSPPKPSVMPIG